MNAKRVYDAMFQAGAAALLKHEIVPSGDKIGPENEERLIEVGEYASERTMDILLDYDSLAEMSA